jgi:anti-sigma factor ChrR (cupin superfamily)
MNHPHPDELLLFANGELAELRLVEVASHVATCMPCQDTLTQLERALVALDAGWPRRKRVFNRPVLWAGFAVGAAAVLAVVLIRQPDEARRAPGWTPTTTWSATAGYVAGGKALMDIDLQLTRLEQESFYGRP